MTPKKLLLCLLPVAAAVGAVSWYSLCFIKSPAFAVKEVALAVKEHDVERFQRHVAVKEVIDRAFDDIIVAESTVNNDNIASNPFALGVLHLLKPTVVDLLTEEALKEVGKKPEKSSASPSTSPAPQRERRDPVSDAMKDTVKRKVFYKHLKLKDLSLSKAEGDRAAAKLLVRNDLVNKDFTLLLALRRNKDEVWQVTAIENLSAVLVEMERARQELELKESRKLLEHMLKVLAIDEEAAVLQTYRRAEKGSRFIIGTEAGTLTFEDPAVVTELVVTARLRNLGTKAINSVHLDLFIKDREDKLVYNFSGRCREPLYPGGSTQLRLSKKLNLHLPADKALLQEKEAKLQADIRPTLINFEDGSSIAPPPIARE